MVMDSENSPRKKALITGVTGQDGSFLVEFLLDKGYEVHGVVRRTSVVAKPRIDHLFTDPLHGTTDFYLEYGDLSDGSSLRHLFFTIEPDEVYNLAAQSHVRVSFEQPEYTLDVGAVGTLRMLEAVKDYATTQSRPIKFYQAVSSEMFGNSLPPQNESTPFNPCSPYAISKATSFWLTANYREAYNLHCTNGILFNHESERRGENFVSRKITRAATRIKMGLQKKLVLGNLNSRRDWGYAKDYVEAMWLMLQKDDPDDYVIATGKSHTVRELLDEAFQLVDLDWKDFVETSPYYFRPTEVNHLQGDATKAKIKLNWESKVEFKELVKIMVDNDLELANREVYAQSYSS